MIIGLSVLLSLSGQGTAPSEPAAVPARGSQSAVFRIEKSGMVHVRVDSTAGTACEISDHLRGPFASGGDPGNKSCDLDLLLDAGPYRARLTSPLKGKGQAQLKVSPFREVQPAVRLEPGASVTATLSPHSQLTTWLRIDKRQAVQLDIAGRTAGKIGLWRDGRWLEELPAEHFELVPRAGRAVHRWRVDAVLEPGEYALVIYGTDAKRWTQAGDDDTVHLVRGARAGNAAGVEDVTIPAWGFVSLASPDPRLAALVELEASPAQGVRLLAFPLKTSEVGLQRAAPASCDVTPTQPIPTCALLSHGDGRHQLELVGPAGTRARLLWSPMGGDAANGGDGFFAARGAPHHPGRGKVRAFVSAPALPLTPDEAPLGCALDEVDNRGELVRRVAWDVPRVSWTEPFERRFNTDATSTAIWVGVDKPGLYTIKADPKTKASCELFRLDDRGGRERVGEGSDGKCEQSRALGAGIYEVRLYGGRPGIQTLRIAASAIGAMQKATTAPKVGCSFPHVDLGGAHLRLVTNGNDGATVRGLFARAEPLAEPRALPLVLDPGQRVTLDMAAGAPVIVRTRTGAGLSCKAGDLELPVANGACKSAALAQTTPITLLSKDAEPILVTVARELPAPAAVPTPAHAAPELRLSTLQAERPMFFDFSRQQSRSVLVQVTTPGLYDLATEGLLATQCRVRTATIARLADGAQNGRGRNCLVQAYLRPGTYLFTATAEGLSAGRASLRLIERAPQALGTVAVDDELFFRVPAGELVQQTLDVKRGGSLQLDAGAQDAELSCRLDDHDGWPALPVPTECKREVELEAGLYTLSTLPLTVDSRRRTALLRPREEPVLSGNKVHTLELNRRATARLGDDGQDELRFVLAADLTVGIELDHGVQGRLFSVNERGERTILDTVPPSGGLEVRGEGDEGDSEPGEQYGEESGGEGGDEGYSEGTSDESGEQYGEESGEEYGGLGSRGEYAESDDWREQQRQQQEQEREAAALAMASATTPREPPAPAGHRVALKAGTYLLQTQHSRGDVAITYGVMVGVHQLAPGVHLQAPVPGRIAVQIPATADARSGLVRLKTHGDLDVRCRLFDASGALLVENGDSGADWNCAMAQPLAPGSYTLLLESEQLRPGSTTLDATFLEAKDTGELKEGDNFRVVAKVASAPLPPAATDQVHDVLLSSDTAFSCAAQDEAGVLVARLVSVTRCRLLLWPGTEAKRFRVFVWTPDRPASVKASYRRREVRGFSGGNLADDVVGRARIDVPGRYTTAAGALCRPAAAGGGALVGCADATSLEAGEVLLALPSGGRLSLDEQVAALTPLSDEQRRALTGARAAERQRSAGRALHVVEVLGARGSVAEPACAMERGAAVREEGRCVAASGPTEQSTLTTWTRADRRLEVTLARRALPWPSTSSALALGVSELRPAGGARYALPAGEFRLDLSLPDQGLAVLLDAEGRAIDLCAPKRAALGARRGLASCVLRGRGGEVAILGELARADLLALATPQAPRALVGVHESSPRPPGRERLLLAKVPAPRSLRVEGPGARACAIHLGDGKRIAGCRGELPAGVDAELVVEHDGRPWRAFAFTPSAGAAPSGLEAARFGALPAAASASATAGVSLPLTGAAMERSVTLAQPSVVRLRAASGVCALASGARVIASRGHGESCDVVRVLPAGTHRAMVRSFAGVPLVGQARITWEPVVALDEGVGPELVAAPGEARALRFTLGADGEVGIGLKVEADTLHCTLRDSADVVVGDGCHQFHRLPKGAYQLFVEAPPDGPPRRFSPVVFGLKGSQIDVPEEWLREFFARVKRPQSTEVTR